MNLSTMVYRYRTILPALHILRRTYGFSRYGRNSLYDESYLPNPVFSTMDDPMIEHVLARHNPRAQFPGTQAASDIFETGNDFIHCWALLGIILNHIVHERFHKLKPISAFGSIDKRITLNIVK